MALKDALLPEFDHEMALTRRLLERVPLRDPHWRPHPKSMSIGMLATHLAEIPTWVPALLREAGYDLDKAGGGPEAKHETVEQLVSAFDQNVSRARELIAMTSDAQFMEPWTMRENGKELFTMPRVSTVRSFLLSHMIHHRGQLSVFLRLRNVPVPSIYGPSADER